MRLARKLCVGRLAIAGLLNPVEMEIGRGAAFKRTVK
jgi:hypothetical protein